MKKLMFLTLALVFTFGFSATAFAGHDIDQPPWDGTVCQVCHGAVEDNFVPNVVHQGDTTQTLTLRNVIRFKNQYALKVFKVELANTSNTPMLDLGALNPDSPAFGTFWTHIFSNAPYLETYTWTNFSDGSGGPDIPEARMFVNVTDGGGTMGVSNGGTHPGGPHTATPNAGNWERVDLTVDTEWFDPVGTGLWDSTLDIVIAQQ